MTTELAEPSDEPRALLAVIARAAADPAVDIDKMERLLALQERVLAKQAEVAFNEAMRQAQAAMPRIKRNKRNSQTNSNYADLEHVHRAIVPIATANGFSMSFGTAEAPVPDVIRVTCKVSHTGGHSRDYQADVALDSVGLKGTANKTLTHAFGSTVSYGRRYLTLLIFNVALTDEDDDGTGSSGPMSAEHAADIQARCEAISPEIQGRILKSYKVATLTEIADSQYSTIIDKLAKTTK